mgnify:CR=1 FL=1
MSFAQLLSLKVVSGGCYPVVAHVAFQDVVYLRGGSLEHLPRCVDEHALEFIEECWNIG